MEKNIAILERVVTNYESNILPRQLQLIDQVKFAKRGALMVWNIEAHKALKALWVDKDIEQSKQHFHVCGRIDEVLINKHGSSLLDWATNHLSLALLSDNQALIQRIANLEHSGFEITKKDTGAVCNAIQNSIKGDDEALSENIKTLKRLSEKSNSKDKPFYTLSSTFFEKLLENDEVGIQERINSLLDSRKRKRKSAGDIIGGLIAIPEIGYLKLAWMKGMNISIEHSLIPMDLLPINPNNQYSDTYEFLNKRVEDS